MTATGKDDVAAGDIAAGDIAAGDRILIRAKAVRVRDGVVQAKIPWAPACLRGKGSQYVTVRLADVVQDAPGDDDAAPTRR
jgi:hypothetical protein